MRVYYSKDADRRLLRNLSVGIIGYGSQGRAQAENMRDSGLAPLVGLRSRSRSRRTAYTDGFEVTTVGRLVKRCDVIFFLAPDHSHGKIYKAEVGDRLRPGQMLVFAHAASVHFGAVKPPDDVDTILIAPLGPGKRLRELYQQKSGVTCFFAVHHDATGRAREVGLALAQAIGCLRSAAIETTFAEEAVGDLFGEQAVLCGGLARLVKLGFDTLVENGLAPEKAYLECVYQIDLIVDLIKSDGIAGMLKKISKTAAFGAIESGPKALDDRLRKNFERVYRDVESGRFFAALMKHSPKDRLEMSRLTDDRFEKAARRVGQLLRGKNQ